MDVPNGQVDWQFRTLLIIWAALFVCHFLFLLFLYMCRPDGFPVDDSRPFIGENYIVVPLAVFLTLLDLAIAYYRHKTYLLQSSVDKDPQLVQTALIVANANMISISLYGLTLAWFFDYPYFYLWSLVAILGTVFYYPRRKALAAAKGL